MSSSRSTSLNNYPHNSDSVILAWQHGALDLTKSLVDCWMMGKLKQDMLMIVEKQLLLEMFVDESLEMIVDESLDMIEDESFDMIVDESLMVEDISLEKLMDETLMVEDKSLEKLVDETLKLDDEHFESVIANCKLSNSC
ncbi:hypothetical protein Tco_0083467 [Tanacetum coccineum]